MLHALPHLRRLILFSATERPNYWAGLHYAFMLPGELLAGTPPLAH
jgi:hypothetical protein